MRRILYLLPDLDYRGHARQASLLALSLQRDRFNVAIACLSNVAPMGAPLSQAGIPIQPLQRGHRFDFQHWFDLRRLVRDFQPDLIHVWGIDALRTLRYALFLKGAKLPPLIVSLPPSSLRVKRLGWWERRLLSRAARIIGTCEADRIAFAAAGLSPEKTRVIRPGVSRAPGTPTNLGIPGPILMTCGHMHGFGRLQDAIWVAEILSYVAPRMQLVVVGEGDFHLRILDYFRDMPRIADSVHFLGARPDAPALLQCADVVLVPHRRLGGAYTTLEAMAAGRAVVTTRLPHLEALIRDGENGLLATPADQPGLARACLQLLENEALRARLGAAARETAEREFSLEVMAAQFAAAYDEASIR